MRGGVYRLVDTSNGRVLAEAVRAATSARDRAFGLMLLRALPHGNGIWLNPCNGVHTGFMRFPLDVIVLDSGTRVVRVVRNLKPWRVLLPVRGGHSTVELAAGSLDGELAVGTGVSLEPRMNADGRG